MKVKVDIISGFLGAGKTTLIKKLIEDKLSKEKIMIIENEFGEVGIDGGYLSRLNVNVSEINSGCICCSVSGDFSKALISGIREYNPERIIIEPTGIAKLSEILLSLNKPEINNLISLNMIITVVDALKYEAFITNFSEFYKNQISNAKTIILSHTDKLSQDIIDNVAEKIKQVNKSANIIKTPLTKINGKLIIDASERDNLNTKPININLINNHNVNSIKLKKEEHIHHDHKDYGGFETYAVESLKAFSNEKVRHILNEINNKEKYGQVIRAKGIVKSDIKNFIKFDYVNGEIQLENVESESIGKICVIGSNLNCDNIKKLFLELSDL